MLSKRLLLMLFIFSLPALGFTQNFDSISAIRPCSLQKLDTVIRFVHFRETAYSCDGKILSAGNKNKRGEKDGPWLYYTPTGSIAGWGIYRRNKKTGWWHGPGQTCKIKYKKNEITKRVCP